MRSTAISTEPSTTEIAPDVREFLANAASAEAERIRSTAAIHHSRIETVANAELPAFMAAPDRGLAQLFEGRARAFEEAASLLASDVR